MTVDERIYALGLMRVPGIGSRRIQQLRLRFGTLAAAWHAVPADLLTTPGLGRGASEALDHLRRTPNCLDHACREVEDLDRRGIAMVLEPESAYPPLLREIADPPAALFVRGEVPGGRCMVALVGTRRATAYGMRTARRLGSELAAHGIVVVSGLALGIDTAAHTGALETGTTLVVLGSGLDHLGPASNRRLAERIVAEGGAILSEYPPSTPPAAGQFPARNRIVSGMCRATVVIEAPFRSGALITADLALEQGREVMAVPGPIDVPQSAGCHQLIAQGAKIVTRVEDVLEDLPGAWEARFCGPQARPDLPSDEARVFAVLGPDPCHVDRIVTAAGLAPAVVIGILLVLELKTLIVQLPGNHYIRHP